MNRLQWFFIYITFALVFLGASDLDFSGYVRNYTGMYASDDAELSILKNSFDLTLEYSSANTSLLVNPYVNTDWGETGDLDFRELYVDLYFDTMDFRVGRQQVIWGKSDGVFITDVVSPKNLQEFILPDFKEVRLGIDAAKINYYLGNGTFEFIWVPVFTPNIMPDEDSIWNINHIDFSGSSDSIDADLENSEYFARYSLMMSVFDIELTGASMWDDEPVITSMAPLEFDHKRLLMAGGSFSSTLGDFILRGEGGFSNGKSFAHETGSLSESDYLHYMGGIDYSLSGYKFSIQFIQRIILDYEDSMVSDQFGNTMTFMINKKFFRDTLTTEIFAYVEFDELNALVRPKITYDFDDGFTMLTGANVFMGDEGTYGQFDSNDMIYTQLKLNF